MIDANQSSTSWLLPDETDAAEVASRMAGDFRPVVTRDRQHGMVLYDTFVWQLWKRGLLLCRLDDTCMLCDVRRPLASAPLAECKGIREVPRFAWDWPPGPMREELQSTTGIRALIPVAAATVASSCIDLRNEDDKTVARVIVERYIRSGEDSPRVLRICRIQPLRGYDRERATAEATMHAWGLPVVEQSAIQMVLEQAGIRPDECLAEPRCVISPSMTIRGATRCLAADSLDAARSREAGIVADIDTEFLHDYRVALRRVRSLIKLVKNVYPASVTVQLQTDLADCARRTNRLRDLDVYLLNRAGYLDCVPPDLAGALDGLFDGLRRERAREQKKVARHLGSDAYERTMRDITETFSEERWWPVTINSHEPVVSVADRLIQKRYKKINRMIGGITEQSPDAEVHDVRLEAKKLRYLLEFFKDLYPENTVGRVIRRLKKLQNGLGIFNDLAVQQDFLREFAREDATAGSATVELTLGVGSLLGTLFQRQREVRVELHGKLAAFTDHRAHRLVEQLFENRSRAA